MSLAETKTKQIVREGSDEFQKEQERITDSAGKHVSRMLVAGMVTGLATAIPPHITGAVFGLELLHQMGAATVDLRKHELNKKKGETIVFVSQKT